jgi:hypothetical protein
MLLACGGVDEAATSSQENTPAEAKQVIAPEKPEAPAEVVVETDEEVGAQCKALLKTYWTEIQPAMDKLQIPDPASFEEKYTVSGYETGKFLKACQFVNSADRKCLVEAPVLVAGPESCGIERDKAGGKELKSPKMPGESPLFDTPALADGGASTLANLNGIWLNTSRMGTQTWVIGRNGKTTQERTDSAGKAKEKNSQDSFVLSFSHALKGHRAYTANSQGITFFMPSKNVFYASGNLMFAAFNMKDGKNFVVTDSQNTVLVVDGGCEVVTRTGIVVPATCGLAERDGKSFFDLSYQIPGKVHWDTGASLPNSASFVVIDNHAVVAKLAEAERFERQ